MLTGIQRIYANEKHAKLIDDGSEGRCRICGGPLFGSKSLSMKKVSASWTDENIVEDLASEYICPACEWFVSKGAKSEAWHQMPAMVVEEGNSRFMKFPEFAEVLKNRDFTFPVVLAVHGEYNDATKKHIEWKSTRCVSQNPKRIYVAMSGMHLFHSANGSILDGIAQFDLDEWVPFLKKLEHYAKHDLYPNLNPKSSDRQKAHIMAQTIISALAETGGLSEASYLAGYLAGYSVAFEHAKKEEKGEKAA